MLAYPVLATLIRELKEMQEVVAAFDASVEPFEEYNAASVDAMGAIQTTQSMTQRTRLIHTPTVSES